MVHPLSFDFEDAKDSSIMILIKVCSIYRPSLIASYILVIPLTFTKFMFFPALHGFSSWNEKSTLYFITNMAISVFKPSQDKLLTLSNHSICSFLCTFRFSTKTFSNFHLLTFFVFTCERAFVLKIFLVSALSIYTALIKNCPKKELSFENI